MNASPVVSPSGDDATATEATQGYGPRPAEQLEDAPTIEFALGLRRQISLGTPPPPPTDLYEIRLGRDEPRPGGRRLRMLAPVVVAGMVFAAIGVGMTLRGGVPSATPSASPVARATTAGTAAATTAPPSSESPASPSPEASPSASAVQDRALAPPPAPNPTVTTTPPVPPVSPVPALVGPGSVTVGVSMTFYASGFPCGAGAQVKVTISLAGGAEYLVFDGSSPTDPQGGATIRLIVDGAGQVAVGSGPPTYVTLSPGEWTVRATPDQAGCTSASATSTFSVISA